MISFETIQEKIQQFKHPSLTELIFDKLQAIQKQPDYLYPFWRLLVLLKWSFLHSKEGKFKRRANKHDLEKIIKLIEKFESEYSILSFADHSKVKQFFTITAFQQFAYQDFYSNSIIDRQLVIYLNISGGINISEEFKKLTGIELINFFNYCYLTYIYLHLDQIGGYVHNGKLDSDYFGLFTEKFSKEEMDKFLDLITIKDNSDFADLHKLKKEILQLYETNFFVTKPLIYFKGEYRIPHRDIFLQTVNHFVYNYLKRHSPAFPDTFGTRLEKYVEMGLIESRQPYQNEGRLKTRYALGKVSDFYVEPNILIEVKATELHPRSGVSRTAGTLQDDLKTSIVKAYTQLLATAHAINKDEVWYGVIVTYKEMYLGFGPDAWEEFLKEPTELFAAKMGISMNMLPPENIFFVSISDWDWIVQALKDNVAPSLKNILDTAKENNMKGPADKVFMMEQILRKYFYVPQFRLSYHQEAHKLLDILPETTNPGNV